MNPAIGEGEPESARRGVDPARPRPGRWSKWRLGSGVTLAFLCGGLLLAGRRFELILVVGDSMLPTFRNGNVLLVDRGAWRSTEPRRGEIVIVRRGTERLVKRVVGLPGEEVEVSTGKLRVNGALVSEPYPVTPGALTIEKGRLGPGRFAVLGDNRSLPPEQLVHGIIPRDAFVGRVVARGGRPAGTL